MSNFANTLTVIKSQFIDVNWQFLHCLETCTKVNCPSTLLKWTFDDHVLLKTYVTGNYWKTFFFDVNNFWTYFCYRAKKGSNRIISISLTTRTYHTRIRY